MLLRELQIVRMDEFADVSAHSLHGDWQPGHADSRQAQSDNGKSGLLKPGSSPSGKQRKQAADHGIQLGVIEAKPAQCVNIAIKRNG